MNKLKEIFTIVLVSSSVFVLLDSAKRNLSPKPPAPAANIAQAAPVKELPLQVLAPAPAVNNAQIVREKKLPVPVLAPKSYRAKAAKAGLRDAVRDNVVNVKTAGNTEGNDLAYITGSAARSNPPVSDRAGYLAYVKSEKDIFVSRVYNNKTAAINARPATVNKLKSKHKAVLFSSLMRYTAGGFFYVIRVEPSAINTVRTNPITDRSEQLYINTLKGAAARVENECRAAMGDRN
jgi:hypothetical protein